MPDTLTVCVCPLPDTVSTGGDVHDALGAVYVAVTLLMVHALFVLSVAVYVSLTLPIVQLSVDADVDPSVCPVVWSVTVTLSPFGFARLIACEEPDPLIDSVGGFEQVCGI